MKQSSTESIENPEETSDGENHKDTNGASSSTTTTTTNNTMMPVGMTTSNASTTGESKTKSQDEMMKLIAEARETDKKKEEQAIRAQSPSQVAKREADALAEYNALSQEMESELNSSSSSNKPLNGINTSRDPTDSIVSTASNVSNSTYPAMSPRESIDSRQTNALSVGGEGSDGQNGNDVLDDARKASRGRSDRTSSTSSSGTKTKTRKKRSKVEWKLRRANNEQVELNKHLSENPIVSPLFSLFEVVTTRVSVKDPVTKKDKRDEKGRVVLEKKVKEARRLVFPFSILSENPHELVSELAREGILQDLSSSKKGVPDFKLPLKEMDFDRISDELTRMKNDHALAAVEWWCKEKAKLNIGRDKGRSIWSVSFGKIEKKNYFFGGKVFLFSWC